MTKAINCHTTNINPNIICVNRLELFFLVGECVINFEHCDILYWISWVNINTRYISSHMANSFNFDYQLITYKMYNYFLNSNLMKVCKILRTRSAYDEETSMQNVWMGL